MRKFTIRIYIIYMAIVLITVASLSFAYVTIQDRYISNVICDSLQMMDSEAAVLVNTRVEADYTKFITYIDSITDSTDVEDLYNKVNDMYMYYEGFNTYKLGVATSDFIVLNDVKYTYVKSKTFAGSQFDNGVSFYSFNEIVDSNDLADGDVAYTIFKYKDIILYLDTESYLQKIISTIDGMPENYYMIVDFNGNICYQENPNRGDRIYSNASDIIDTSYTKLLGQLNEEGYITLSFDVYKGSSFLVHVPLVKNQSKVRNTNGELVCTYSLVYVFEKDAAVENYSYLSTTLLVNLITIGLVINIALLVCIILYFRKEQDMSVSRIRYFFAKPFVLVVDKTGRIKDKNRTFMELVTGAKDYKNASDFEVYEPIEDINAHIKTQKSFTALVRDSSDKTMYIRFLPMKILSGFSLLGEDVTVTMTEVIKNSKIALYNNITHLPNTNVLSKDIDQLIHTKKIENNLNALVGFDAVDFAKINKMFGFQSGDKLLREVATRLQDSISIYNAKLYNSRTSQFYILFTNLSSFNDVITWSKDILKRFTQPVEIKNDYLANIEVKIGIYNIAYQADINPRLIIDCAYNALERSVNSRLTKVSIYNAEFSQMLSRDQIMERDLEDAIKSKDFEMFYQPQYNTKIGKIIGFEALVRWKNPKYKNESPEHFVTIAEKNGLIVELGKIIIEKTFDFAKAIEDSGIHVSMNVSPAQLMHAGFINMLLNYYSEYKLKPHAVAIEITETFLMENQALMVEKLRVLQEKGFSIHLDDFGIGYSSMLYLKDLPIDTIKIDKEFTRNIEGDRFSRNIVSKVSQLGLGLDLNIIVEGVENEKQMNILSKMGCDVIQGYLISKPVDTVGTLALIKKYNGITLDISEEITEKLDDITVATGPVAKQKTKKKKKANVDIISTEAIDVDEIINSNDGDDSNTNDNTNDKEGEE